VLQLHNGQTLPADRVEEVTLVENLPADVLEQLQAELGGTDSLPEPGVDSDSPPATQRRILADSETPGFKAGDPWRALGQFADRTASALGALLSPAKR